jgi:glutamate/tyrosine decarboxylase-like PLP-dependent enzyme
MIYQIVATGVKMVQANQTEQAFSCERKQKDKRQLHITFHNPNTTEEMIKLLTKAIIKNLIDRDTVPLNNKKEKC